MGLYTQEAKRTHTEDEFRIVLKLTTLKQGVQPPAHGPLAA